MSIMTLVDQIEDKDFREKHKLSPAEYAAFLDTLNQCFAYDTATTDSEKIAQIFIEANMKVVKSKVFTVFKEA